ncbi:hypothetical protein BpHYR1_012727, partial [Brachionus plicatilis]
NVLNFLDIVFYYKNLIQTRCIVLDLTNPEKNELEYQDFANAASAMVNTIFSLANSFISFHSISIGFKLGQCHNNKKK